MVSQILAILGRCITFAYEIFNSFYSSSGILAVFISFFMILLVVRMLIIPLVGGSMGSDKVKKKGANK